MAGELKQAPHTPSFYSSEHEWAEFLALAPNYCLLQAELLKALPARAKNVLDLGSATGDTAFKIAGALKKAKILATDSRAEVLAAAKTIALRKNAGNVSFQALDFERAGEFLAAKAKKGIFFDVVTMLYSFHHLQDPLSNKKRFAKALFSNLPKGARVIIADVCVREKFGSKNYAESARTQWLERWNYVFKGVYAALLSRLRSSGIKEIDAKVLAHKAAQKAADLESEAGKLVEQRTHEYPVTNEELKEIFEGAGFKVKLKQVNEFGETILTAWKRA